MSNSLRELKAQIRRLQREANEPAATRELPDDSAQQAPKIVRPGNPYDYLNSAMVGWLALRRDD